jgi:hypothetical protein
MGEEGRNPAERPWAGTFGDPFTGVALLALVVAAWLSFSPALFNDGDTSWHLATGRWIVEHGAVPQADPFSFTHRGHPWTAHEWLVDVAMALASAAAGWAGVALLFSLPIALAVALVGRELAQVLPWQRALVVLALLTAVLAPFMLARPHVLSWPMLAIWTIALLRARERGEAPHLALALLIVLWANLHASFIFALFLAGMFGLEALIASADRKRAFLRWALFGALAFACALATPHGLQAFLYPFQVSGMESLSLIDEWRATELPEDWLFVIFACAISVVAALRWRHLSLVRLLLLGILAALASAHSRHQPLFAIVSVLLLARSAAAAPLRQSPARVLLALGIGVTLVAAVRLAIPLQRGDGRTYPATALAALPSELRSAPVLNSYSFGGPLILHEIAPFIDGRADMYGDAHTLFHQRMMRGDVQALEQARQRWGIRWTILHPAEPLVRALDRNPIWRRLYTDEFAVIHVPR